MKRTCLLYSLYNYTRVENTGCAQFCWNFCSAKKKKKKKSKIYLGKRCPQCVIILVDCFSFSSSAAAKWNFPAFHPDGTFLNLYERS